MGPHGILGQLTLLSRQAC